jgi:orotate phosphoribosyltransferase
MLGIKQRVAKVLLESGCVCLKPQDPFTYASGLKGPIYCDNRQILSHVEGRNVIVDAFLEFIKEHNLKFDAVAGLATGGIPHASFIAQKLDVPMLYVRSKAKGHGKQSLIEGDISNIKRVLLIEDLINQGSSLGKVIQPIKQDGIEVEEVLSVVSYAMKKADDVAKENNMKFYSLTDFSGLVETGVELGMIKPDQKQLLMDWQQDPAAWSQVQS